MAHIGEIGKRSKVIVTYKKSFEYTDFTFNYYGTTHRTHLFEDSEGNVIVWKSTKPVEYIKDGEAVLYVPEGSVVELTGSVKEHGEYKGQPQTVVTRCKFKMVEVAKSKEEIEREKAAEQMARIKDGDYVWEMPYRQYKEHYADCETLIGSFKWEDGRATVKVIIRDGRLKKSGVRGEHYRGFEFITDNGTKVVYRAISEETARRQMKKEYPDSEGWELNHIYHYNLHRYF